MKLLIITLLLYTPLSFAKKVVASNDSQCVWNGSGEMEVRVGDREQTKNHFGRICGESGTRSSCIKQRISKHWQRNSYINICKWVGKIDSDNKYGSCKQVGDYKTTVLTAIPAKKSKHLGFTDSICENSETIICTGAMLCGKKDYYDDVICLGNKYGACPSIQECAASAKVKTHFPKKFDIKYEKIKFPNKNNNGAIRE
jgi:hypothetical protein